MVIYHNTSTLISEPHYFLSFRRFVSDFDSVVCKISIPVTFIEMLHVVNGNSRCYQFPSHMCLLIVLCFIQLENNKIPDISKIRIVSSILIQVLVS